jgi:hypothetical protein
MTQRATQAVPRRTPPWPTRAARKPTEPVLLVLDGEGNAEVYAERHVQVHVALRLTTDGGNLGEQAADELLTLTLPPKFRALYFANRLRGAGLCERRTAADELDRRAVLRLLSELRELRESLQ